MESKATTEAIQVLENSALTNLAPLVEAVPDEEAKSADAEILNADPISAVLSEADSVKSSLKKYGVLTGRPMNAWIDESIKLPDPRTYCRGMIVEGENSVIFAYSNVGKTAFTMQAVSEIARWHKVAYVDFEMSQKQLEMRYVDKESGAIHHFPENFYRMELNAEDIEDEDLETAVLNSVEILAQQGFHYIVIDNLSFVCSDGEKAVTACLFMRRLIRLKRKYGLTTIVVAHTPKRRIQEPITQNDLAGSAKLMALFDAGIAIARSAVDNDIRYVKQVKVRTGELIYGQDNVILYDVVKEDGFLKFEFRGYGKEDDHLKGREAQDDTEDILSILRLQKDGKSFRDIAKSLDLSLGKVQRLLKKAKEEGITLEKYESQDVSERIGVSDSQEAIQQYTPDTVRLPFKDEE